MTIALVAISFVGVFLVSPFSNASSNPEGLQCVKNGHLFLEIIRLIRGQDQETAESAAGVETTAAGETTTASTTTTGTPTTPLKDGNGGPTTRTLNKHRPRAILLENVPNLLKLEEGRVWQEIQSRLESEGYTVYHKLISTASAGLPQSRVRLYIVGISTGESVSKKHGQGKNDSFVWPVLPFEDFYKQDEHKQQKQQHHHNNDNFAVRDGMKTGAGTGSSNRGCTQHDVDRLDQQNEEESPKSHATDILMSPAAREASGEAATVQPTASSKRPRTALTVSDILEPHGPETKKHRLSRHQWTKTRAHRSWKTSTKPGKRLVDLDGNARTIGANYRTGYLVQSEFVPWKGHSYFSRNRLNEEQVQKQENVSDNIEEEEQRQHDVVGHAVGDGRIVEGKKFDVENEEHSIDRSCVESETSSSSASESEEDLDGTRSTTNIKEPRIARPRFFTPRECARLQGFPESFVIEGKRNPNRWYHQCGNAVAPPVVAAIAKQILRVLKPAHFLEQKCLD